MEGIRLGLESCAEIAKKIHSESEARGLQKRGTSQSISPGLATNSIILCFLFCKKSSICLEGKSMTPYRGNTILFRSSQQLPRLPLGPLNGFLS